jgi:hypothetical protein
MALIASVSTNVVTIAPQALVRTVVVAVLLLHGERSLLSRGLRVVHHLRLSRTLAHM